MQETTTTETETIDPKRRYLCRHVFTEGHRCGSPALRGQSLCYNHNRSRREAGISGKSGTFPMPRIDDRASIQLALYEVLSRLAGGDIEYKRGSILLYGLQIASSNLPHRAKSDAQQQPQVEEVTSDYDLGDLAPIAEIVTPQQETEASLVELETANPERAKMKRWLASLRQPINPKNGSATPLCLPQPDPDHSLPQTPSIEVVILSAAKNPRIPPEAPQNSEHAEPLAAEMWTPASGQLPTFSSPHTLSSPQPITLAAIQAVAACRTSNPEPRTSTLNLPRFPHPPARSQRLTIGGNDVA
jgi:hypothetical protein